MTVKVQKEGFNLRDKLKELEGSSESNKTSLLGVGGLYTLHSYEIKSGVSEFELSLYGEYNTYYFTFDRITVSTTTNGDMGLQVSYDNGSSYEDSYRYTVMGTNPGFYPFNLDLTEPQLKTTFTMRSGEALPAMGWGYILPGDSTNQTSIMGVSTYHFNDGTDNEIRMQHYGGSPTTNGKANYVKFFMTANTFASGRIFIYGIK